MRFLVQAIVPNIQERCNEGLLCSKRVKLFAIIENGTQGGFVKRKTINSNQSTNGLLPRAVAAAHLAVCCVDVQRPPELMG